MIAAIAVTLTLTFTPIPAADTLAADGYETGEAQALVEVIPGVHVPPDQVDAVRSYLEALETAYPALDSWLWDRLAWCESRGDWSIDGRYDGGLQFHPATWDAAGGRRFARYAHQATPGQQIAIARIVRDQAGGYSPWPGCARQLRLPR